MPIAPTSDLAVRTISARQPLLWLVLGARDMVHAGWISVAHGLLLAAGGAAIVAAAHDRFWLLAGALSGFMVIAPALATSLYALSRALERRQRADASVLVRTWLNWQDGHFNKWDNDYWCLAQFGGLLAMAATGWVLTSAALITLLAPLPIQGPLDFVRHVVLAREGWLFEAWLALGGVIAAPMFASSVVSMPLLLDRRVTLSQAVLCSWQTVLANPVPLGLWATIIMLLTLLGLASFLLGLILVIPILGHASWHAYRALVDASGLPTRETTDARR